MEHFVSCERDRRNAGVLPLVSILCCIAVGCDAESNVYSYTEPDDDGRVNIDSSGPAELADSQGKPLFGENTWLAAVFYAGRNYGLGSLEAFEVNVSNSHYELRSDWSGFTVQSVALKPRCTLYLYSQPEQEGEAVVLSSYQAEKYASINVLFKSYAISCENNWDIKGVAFDSSVGSKGRPWVPFWNKDSKLRGWWAGNTIRYFAINSFDYPKTAAVLSVSPGDMDSITLVDPPDAGAAMNGQNVRLDGPPPVEITFFNRDQLNDPCEPRSCFLASQNCLGWYEQNVSRRACELGSGQSWCSQSSNCIPFPGNAGGGN